MLSGAVSSAGKRGCPRGRRLDFRLLCPRGPGESGKALQEVVPSGLPRIPPAGGGFFSRGSAPGIHGDLSGRGLFLGLSGYLRVPRGAGAGPEPAEHIIDTDL